jgi:hypothetical protein
MPLSHVIDDVLADTFHIVPDKLNLLSCTFQDAIDDLKSDLEEEVNKLLSNVLNLSGTIDTGTTIMDVTNGTATIIRRISSTFGTTIDIECPDNT